MTSQSRFYSPAVFTGNLELKEVLVYVFAFGKRQPNPTKIKVREFTKLDHFKRHLAARGLSGSLYIDGTCCDKVDEGEVLELWRSKVEVRVKTQLKLSPSDLSEVTVYTSPPCGTRQLPTIKGLKCFRTTRLDDLMFFIQDHASIPVEAQLFKGIRPDGGVTRKLTNLRKYSPNGFEMYGMGNLLLVVDHQKPKCVEKLVPNEELHSVKARQLISQEIGHWKGLARLLGLQDNDIEEILESERHVPDQRYKALLFWHRQNGAAATWRALVRACIENKNLSLAEKIVEICKSWIYVLHICNTCAIFSFCRQVKKMVKST